MLCLLNYGGFRHSFNFSQLRDTTSSIQAAMTMIISSIIVIYIFQINFPSHITILSQITFAILLIIVPSLTRLLIARFFPNLKEHEPTIIIGLGEMGKSFIELQKKTIPGRFDIIGIFDDKKRNGNKFLDYSVRGKIEDIAKINFEKMPRRIIVAVRYLTDSKIKYIQTFASRNNISLNFLPSIESFKNNPVKLKDHYGIPLLTIEKNEQSIFYKFGKRLFDIFFSLILFLLSLPLWIVIPFIIKKDSPGKIFFHQDRVGLNNKEFKIYKFRSMKSNTPKYANCPTDSSDMRVTKVGRWLRKTSIDELPQILNILKGEMSVIGPRPEMPFIVNKYNSIERNRLLVKPGLTGLWQVSPYRNSDISHNLEYDFYYIENQGFILDFIILLMTVFFVVKGITN